MTPDGPYRRQADWLVACDAARSPLRGMLGLNFEGRVFEDTFLIADVKMKADFPTERWFWFEPHFRSGDSALLHKQPDDIWRIDFQLGWNIDRAHELEPANIRKRVDAPLGDGWLLRHLAPGFTLLTINLDARERLAAHGLTVPRLSGAATPEITARYLGTTPAAVYLIRPDQHVAARWDHFDADAVTQALARAIGKG